MSLLSLANEILLLIAEELQYLKDVSSLFRTNKRLNSLLTTHLYTRAKSVLLLYGTPPARMNAVQYKETLLNHLTRGALTRPATELLNVGASISESRGGAPYALYTAAKHGHEELVKLMISRSTEKASVACKPMPDGRTALHAAAENGHDGIVRLLLREGFSEKHQIVDGATPLALAVKNNHEQVVRTLFDFGASPNVKLENLHNRMSKHIIHWIAENAFKLMVLRGQNFLPILRMLLDNGGDVMARDNYRATPLHSAAKNGEPAGRFLFDSSGVQGKMEAARVVHNEVVALLIERGADCNARDQGRKTPLHDAAENLDAFMVRKLLENGADRRLVNSASKTPLRSVSSTGRRRTEEVVALLQDWSIGMR